MSEIVEVRHEDWADTKYRPKSFDDIVGNDWNVNKLRRLVKEAENFPSLMLAGPPGCGKSCCAEIVIRELKVESKEWNASDDRKLETVQKKMKPFAQTASMTKFKIAFLDEMEQMTENAQDALRRIMEKNSKQCRFIMTSNDISRVSKAIQSRCTPIYFRALTDDEVFRKLSQIALKEGLGNIINENQVFNVAEGSAGDMRSAIKVLQSICEGRSIPLNDDDVFHSRPMPDIKKVGNMIGVALNGDFSEACGLLDEILYTNPSEKVFEVIQKMFMESKTMAEKDKILVALGLGRIPAYSMDKNHLYAFVAYLSSRAFAIFTDKETKPSWRS